MPTHAEQRHLPWRPEQLYSVVAEVEHYPKFLPWCSACRILDRQDDVITAEMIISFKVFRERFTSRVTLHPQTAIDVAYIDGPFRYLNNHWRFLPAPDGGCILDFHVDFEFRSRVLQSLIGMLFGEAVRRMVAAFESRARELYGPDGRDVGAPAPASA